MYGCVALFLFPTVSEVWKLRVTGKIRRGEGLAASRRVRGPALDFFTEQFPRALAGYGVGTEAFYLPAYMPDEFRYRLLDYQAAAGLDSFWFSLLLDLGLPGVLLFGWCCIKVLRCPAVARRRTWDYRAALVTLLITGIALPVDLRSDCAVALFRTRAPHPAVGCHAVRRPWRTVPGSPFPSGGCASVVRRADRRLCAHRGAGYSARGPAL
jgi:hypothetical protein